MKNKKRIGLWNKLSESVAHTLKNTPSIYQEDQDNQDATTYEQVIEILKRLYGDKKSRNTIHQELSKCNQNRRALKEFTLDLGTIYEKYNIKAPDREIKDYFINGLDPFYRKLLYRSYKEFEIDEMNYSDIYYIVLDYEDIEIRERNITNNGKEKEKSCKTQNNSAQEKRQNRNMGKERNAKAFCDTCQKSGHWTINCYITCLRCGKSRHSGMDCRTNKVTKDTCYKCGKDGHRIKDCPMIKKDINKKKEVTCYTCKEKGHISTDCPKKKQGNNNSMGNRNKGEKNKDLNSILEEKK